MTRTTLLALLLTTAAFAQDKKQPAKKSDLTPNNSGVPIQKYELGPDSKERHPGVPVGKVTPGIFATSKVYPNTIREYWVYVPAQYDGKSPAALMVFQDGHAYVDEKGQFRVPIVFDNLIAAKQMPVTIGVFVNPGQAGDKLSPTKGWGAKPANRSVEYDTLSGDYAKFLIDELLPVATKGLNVTDDPDHRAICGISSGGICAFTVAWERPDSFRKVITHVGSFTNIRGGHNYPALIRKTEKKPIRIAMQDGINDLDNPFGNWPLANQQMDKALTFKGYDHQFIFGAGAHNGEHGGAVLPDQLRWIWSDAK
jgi:enterochelin esterase family protein